MAKTDWTEVLKRDVGFARQVMLDKGEFSPMFMIHTPEAIKVVLGTWGNIEQKRMVQRLVALQAAADGAECIIFVAEAWMREVVKRAGETEAEVHERAQAISPEQAEDRIEVLIGTAVYRKHGQRRCTVFAMDIVRDEAGKVVALTEREGHADDNGGFLVELLTPHPLSPAQRAAAREGLEFLKEWSGTGIHAMPTVGHA